MTAIIIMNGITFDSSRLSGFLESIRREFHSAGRPVGRSRPGKSKENEAVNTWKPKQARDDLTFVLREFFL